MSVCCVSMVESKTRQLLSLLLAENGVVVSEEADAATLMRRYFDTAHPEAPAGDTLGPIFDTVASTLKNLPPEPK